MTENSSAARRSSAPQIPGPRVLAMQRVKSPAGPLEPAFLGELAAAFGLQAFVETGTFLGNTTAVASGIFQEVHTIELSTELAEKARERFATTPQVHVHQGDSAELLPKILEQLSRPALFWLDGHYSEGVTARGRGNTPILDEIAAIARSGRKDAVILIDDLRLFERHPLSVNDSSSLHGYPTVAEVHDAVRQIDPAYQLFVFGDIAVAFPARPDISVSPLILALTISRLFNGGNLPVEEVIGAESLLVHAEGVEREVLCELPALAASTEKHGLGLHYRLWYGHALLGRNEFQKAREQFLEIQKLGFKHWRIHWYVALASQGAGDHHLARTIADALVEAVPDFAPARELQKALVPPPSPVRPMLKAGQNSLEQVLAAGVYQSGQPLRLHLGCGEQHFDGYVNIDYPPSEHSCQTQIGADVFADITRLQFPSQSVDEIRLHHVFEHFKRSEALALVIRWHESLKIGGRLHLETPDLEGCARQLVSNIPFQVKQVVVRHCFGSQEAGWANHYDGWTSERYHHVLGKFGFSVQTKNWSWPHPPHLANVEAFATKVRNLSRAELLAAADQILSEYMTVDVPSERGMCEVWRKAMRDFLAANEAVPAPVVLPRETQVRVPLVPISNAKLPCPVCQEQAPAVVKKKEQVYHQCPSCECVFTPHIDASVIQTENNGNVTRHDSNQDVERLRRLAQALGRRPEQVIDFGCGQGETTRFLQAQGIQTIGIDQDTPVQLKDVADASMDCILMVEVIEHLYDPCAIFQQFNRVLKTGGVAYIESSFADEKDLQEWGYLEPAIGHCTVHTRRSMAQIAEKNGFKLQWLNPNVCIFTKQVCAACDLSGARTPAPEPVAAAPRRSGEIAILAPSPASDAAGFDDDNPATNGENFVIQSLLQPGNLVLDVGANVGDWSRQVLANVSGVNLHAFEPAPDTFAKLLENLPAGAVTLHQIALADSSGQTTLFRYADHPEFSGMNSRYRRPEVEQRLKLQTAPTTVVTETLDAFCACKGFSKIDFLKIDTEGSEFDVLHGAQNLLAANGIKVIQFEYGGTYRDAGITLRQVRELLARSGYQLFRISAKGLIAIPEWNDVLENYRYANYLAVASKFAAGDAATGNVVVKLQGGLGNQMFQFAAGLALARRNGSRLKLDLSFLRDRTPRPNFTRRDYCLDLFQLPADCEIVPDAAAFAKRLPGYVEQQFHFDPKFFSLGPNAYLDGYFQSEKFFEPVRDEVLRAFKSFTTPLNAEQQALAYKISTCAAVCLNVRRGDYVANPVANDFHGVCDESYFHAAVAEIQKRVPAAHFFIFSDDIEWCRTANLTNGAPFTLVPHEFAGDRFAAYLQLMAACRHFILPNSSFGWWAAFLGEAADKTVIVPAPWFDHPFNNTADMLPASWLRLPKNREAAPHVSVIISCHNYATFLPEAVSSVWNQTYRSFEIILVDDGSTDESPAVARRLAEETSRDIPFHIIRLEDVGPSAARRTAIAQARGKYFLPLDADDRIAPDFLAKTVPLLDADAKLGFAYVDTVFFGEKQQRHHQPEYDFARLCQGNFISHSSLIRKAAFDAVGGYDPENWGYYEDWDLWLRLGGKGWSGKHVGEPLFFYRHHFNSSLSLFARRLDPIYKAFLQSRHPGLYPETVVTAARQTLAEMPAGWNARRPMRDVEELKAILAQHPDNRHLLYFLGCALIKNGATPEAENVLKNLLAMHPNDTQAQDLLKQLTPAESAQSEAGINGLVSVIVPTYNRPDWLGETLKSILAQTYREFEIIVVNDAGREVSQVIEPLNSDGRIRVINHEKNKGLAGARNTGVRAARGQYIAYLDDDDIYHPHHLATLVNHLKASGAEVVYSDAYRGTQRKQGDSYVVAERTVPYSVDWDADKILVHNFVPVLCFLHHKKCVAAAGWFDESLTTHEDWDLWMRMSRLFKFSHVKEITCEFRWRHDGSSMSSERQMDFVRTARIIYAKNPEFVANRPDLQARRQQFLLELSRPPAPAPVPPTPSLLPVSIVIPVFNQVKFTKQCLARLAALPCAVEHEIIIADDCSTDETEAFCRAQEKVRSNLRYFRLPQNGGFGRACNHGAEQARGRWIVFLNNDTEPEAGWIEAAVARLQSDQNIGVVGGRLLYPNRAVQHCGIEFFWGDNPDHEIWPLHRHMGVAENDPRANVAGQVAAVTGACFFIDRELFHRVGGFSPEYRMYFEDADLCFKTWQAGRTVFYEPKCVVIHHESQSSPNREHVDALNKESGEVFFKKWVQPLARIAYDTSLEKVEGRYAYFRRETLPVPPGFGFGTPRLEVIGRALVKLFQEVGPFYMHFGGAGDALLLLATFLDQHPDAQVISFCNSIPAMRSFFDAFPSLKRVLFLPKNGSPQLHILLRLMMRHSPNCLGMGVTPEGDYFKDWHAGLDIFRERNVSRRPAWAQRFKTSPNPKQIVLAPKGSLCGMVGTKRNLIDPPVWPQLIRHICKRGYQPVIIGTPDEAQMYPCLDGCEDRRSLSFKEQMEHIANSAMLIAADSWAKSFSALAGVPTLVFEPMKGADWNGKKDPSDFVFLDPWESITVVKNFDQCRRLFDQFAKGKLPVRSVATVSMQPVNISWEGSFLDHGSLSHVNRELVGELKAIAGGPIHCVSNGAPAVADAGKIWPDLAQHVSAKPAAGATVTVRHAWPPNWRRPLTGKLVVIQPWEFGSLPQDWVNAARTVDEFWLPSNYVRQVYIESGVPAEKVFVVPNGVDAEKFHPQAAPMKLGTQKKFKFLFVGGTIGRKGPDLLLQAYLRNFTAADDVCLVIKDFGGQSVYQGQTFEAQIRAIQAVPNAPEILYLNEELTPECLPGLYTACDCFVMPYRGEGFGLPVLEAMACGLPVVVTAGGATDDFVRDEFACRIPAVKKVFGREVSGLKLAGEGWLLEPDLARLGESMRHVFSHPAEARNRGQLASRHAHQNCLWKKSAAIASERLHQLTSVSGAAIKPAVKPAPVKLPATAHVGQLAEAHALFGQKDFEGAWAETLTATGKRPFHPEAFLLLAEIALAAGNGKIARQCAQRALDLAPAWMAAKQFLNQPLKGEAKAAWLDASRITDHASRVSVCLIVKNEERFLAQCLKSVRGLASQIVVVDTGSTDRTVEIAREFGAEIHSFAWCDDFAAARNVALEHATGDWVLMLDADEELPAAEHSKLLADMKSSTTIAVRLPLVNAGQENEGRSFVPRLFRNAPRVHYVGRIHEQVFGSLLESAKTWGLTTALGTAGILHHGYARELVQDRNKVARNLKLLRAAIEEDPTDVNLLMNLGLELVRSDDLAAGVEKYREAYDRMSGQAPADVVPELREVLLTQFTSHLYKLRDHQEIVRILTSPLARRGGLTASLHFALGLAHFELKQFSEAADQMRQCLTKRHTPCLTPINTDVLSAAPQHCLALCLARLGDAPAAEKTFLAALSETGKLEAARQDYARFLYNENRPVESLTQLQAVVSADTRNVAAWRFGGEIALSRAEYLEFALDWTTESFKALPENAVIAAQYAEALMLNNQPADAAKVWGPIWRSEPEPRTLAALVLCEIAAGQQPHAPNIGADEQAASRAFVEWYQKLITIRAQVLIEAINGRLEPLSQVLPSAAEMLRNALSEAVAPVGA